MINCLIIDDEQMAHEIIKGYCDLLPNLEVKKHCYDAIEALDRNAFVKDLDAISFEDVYAVGVMDENNELSTWKTFDTFEEANNFAGIDGQNKAWLGGLSNGETALVFRTATYAKKSYAFKAQLWRKTSLTHVENAARVIVHEGMHNRGIGHGSRLYNAVLVKSNRTLP